MEKSKKFLTMVMVLTMLLTVTMPGVSLAATVEYGEDNLGSPIQSTRLLSAVNAVMDGKPVMMAVNTGVPARLMIVDLESHSTIDAIDLPYGRSFHTMVTAPSGDVYMAGYTSAHLYKYSVTEKKLTDLGETLGETAICQMTADGDGNIYMGTYPNAKILKYSPANGGITEVAAIYTDDNYCKSLAYYNGALYCGGNKVGTKLVKYDLATGARTEFATPATAEEITALSTMSVAGNRLFINTTTAGWAQHWLVFDLDKEQWKPTINNAGASYASVEKNGYSYLSAGGYICKYNLADDTYQSTGMNGSRVRTVNFASVGGSSVLIDFESENIIYYDIDKSKRTQYNGVVDPSPDIIEGMTAGDGKLYTSGFMGQGGGSVFDTATGKTTPLKSGDIYQAFAIEKIGDMVYFGSYPTAGLSVYDTTLPVSGTNPRSLFTHKELGNARPMDIVAAGSKIVMSVVAGYGQVDGALIVYDTVTGENTVYSGSGFIPGHSPVGLWYDEASGWVYGTTTVYGGLNSTPTEQKAKVFVFDLSTNSVVMSAEPSIAAQENYPNEIMRMCGGLAVDPTTDYKLWCISDGLLFSFDKGTLDVLDQMYIDDMIWSGTSRWKPYSLEFTSTGKLYANPNNDLYEIDVNSKTWTKIASGIESISVDSADQSVYYYYNNGTEAYRLTSVWNPNTEAIQPSQVDGWYYIESAANFLWLKNHPDAKCILARDIQIGTEENPFTAPFQFYGQLKSVGSRKTIDAHIVTESGNTGLFSENKKQAGLVIENIRLTGSIKANGATSGRYVGGFLGEAAYNTTISNCVNEAAISGGQQTGGIIGRLFASGSGNISNCINKGTISNTVSSSSGVLGGIFGFSSGTVTDCGNIGSIQDPLNEIVGGIGGWLGYGGKAERCYNLGSVTGRYYTAGIIGKTMGGNPVVIKDCFNAGSVTGKSPSAGHVAGLVYNLTNATMENCYAVGTLIKGANASAKPVISAGNGTVINTYYVGESDTDGIDGTDVFPSADVSPADIGFSITIWEKVASYAYPKLIGHDLVEAGTDIFPYRVETKADFLAIAENASAVYFLANDIDLGNYTPFTFSGKLYGNPDEMPTINVNIDKSSSDQIGLFSKVSGKFGIENIRLTGSVAGKYQVGGFAGCAADTLSGAHIINCVNEANVRAVPAGVFASGRRVGGFIGDSFGQTNLELRGLVNKANLSGGVQAIGGISGISSAKIYNCANLGNISGNNQVGGMAGWYANGAVIQSSFNAGNISASEQVGGLVGTVQYSKPVISSCYNSGNVKLAEPGAKTIGAAVGTVVAGAGVSMTHCYNVGAVNGDYTYAYAGTSAGTFNADYCYYLAPDGDEDDIADSVSINTMKNIAATLGNAFEASDNNYIFPQIKGNTNTKAVDIFNISDLALTDANGVYTAEIKADSSSAKNCRLILALYKGDALLELVMQSKAVDGAEKFSCTKTLSDASDVTAKAMFWNTDTMKPYCESKKTAK